jgi:hypothetical protein
MPRNERKFWRGDCGHVLGEVEILKLQRRRLYVLALFERSLDHVPEGDPQLRMELIGDAKGIACTICDAKKDWRADDRDIRKFVKAMRRVRRFSIYD